MWGNASKFSLFENITIQMSKKLKYIVGGILLVIGTISDIFFFGTEGSGGYNGTVIPHPLLIGFGGIAVWLVGFWLIKSAMGADAKKGKSKMTTLEEDLKANGDIIKVNVADCVIMGGSLVQEVVVEGNNAVEAYAALADTDYMATGEARVENTAMSVLVCEQEYKGKKRKFTSPNIHKDKTTLSFLLAGQKTTNIYVDKNDENRYYWDLNFLDGEY